MVAIDVLSFKLEVRRIQTIDDLKVLSLP